MKTVLDIPGFAEAVQRENFLRDSAFLPLTENINGFEVRQMTLNDYNALRIGYSPLLPPFWMTKASELAAFLWYLNPGYSLDSRKRNKFLKTCGFIPIRSPKIGLFGRRKRWAKSYTKSIQCLQKTLAAAREYVNDTMMDRPPMIESRGYQPRFYSDVAQICGELAREYGGGPMIYASLPMRLVFQLLNEIRAANIPKEKLTLFNPLSEGVIARHHERN